MEKLITPKGKSYWANNGAYSELFDKKWDELVPANGKCSTIHGELMRCFGRLNYDYGNNGNCNVRDFQLEVCPECDGSGYEEQTCYWCNGKCTVYDEDSEEDCDCPECYGTGVETQDCGYCDGDCTIAGDVLIDENFDYYLRFLKDNLKNSSPVDDLRNFILRKDVGYSTYKFDDDEMSIYNAVGDEVGYQMSTTEDAPRP